MFYRLIEKLWIPTYINKVIIDDFFSTVTRLCTSVMQTDTSQYGWGACMLQKSKLVVCASPVYHHVKNYAQIEKGFYVVLVANSTILCTFVGFTPQFSGIINA